MKNPVLRLMMVGLVLAGAAFAQAPAAQSDTVAQYVNAEMARQHIPGVALLVARNGEIVRAQGFGFANVELQVPVQPETLFQSGSVGKQFTATAIMMLVEQGKIGLDDSIAKYFPEAPPSWKPVTIRHLLTHTGGFHGLSERLRFPQRLQRGRPSENRGWNSPRVSTGHEMELQQSRIPDAGRPHSPGHRQVLWRCTRSAHLSSAWNADACAS